MVLTKRVFVVSELYYPEETSTGSFLTKIAEGLARHFQVRVLCSQPTYGARGRRAPRNEMYHAVDIYRCWSTTFNKDVLPLRMINMITIGISVLLKAIGSIRAGDCVLVVTNPPMLPLVVCLACFLRRVKCVLIIHDVYPEVLIATGASQRASILARAIGWPMKILYRRMTRIVVLGQDMNALVQRKLPPGDGRVMIIPNWADLDLVGPLDRNDNALLNILGLTEKFVIQFSGNIGRTHGIENIVCCAEQFTNDPSVHFLFIGFGGKKKWLAQTIKDRGLSNMTLLDYRPRSDLPHSLNACDVAIISFIKGMVGVSVPSRMYNVMAAGKPIIAMAESESELARVVREEGIGWVIPPGDVDGLRMAIIEAKADPDRLLLMGKRARKVAESKYSFENAIKSYMELVCSLLDSTTESECAHRLF